MSTLPDTKRLGLGLLWGILGYLIAAMVGYVLIEQFSSNVHDRSVEAAMTGIFVVGPIGAVTGFVVGAMRGSRTPDRLDPKG